MNVYKLAVTLLFCPDGGEVKSLTPATEGMVVEEEGKIKINKRKE